MTKLFQARHLRIAGLSVGAVAIGVAAIAVTASASGMSFGFRPSSGAPQSTSDTAALTAIDATSSSAVCSDFMKHFAVEMGKTQAQINAAFQKAVADTLADEVKSGQITQAQADAIKKKLAGQTPCTLPTVRPPSSHAAKGIAAYMTQYLAAAASALGITDAKLTADLKAGQSLSQVAAAQHVSEADFRTRLIAKLKPALDAAVTGKKLTSAQEQAIIKQLQTGTLPLWTARTKHPEPAATPTASPKAAA